MRDVRELLIHGALLVVAAVLGFAVWTHDDSASKVDDDLMAQVWPGKPADVQRVEWDGKAKVSLEPHHDGEGTWYVTTVQKSQVTLKPDHGDAKGKKDEKSSHAKPPKPEEKTIRFLAVDSAKQLVEALAPLRAYRALGNYDESRKADFGFEEPEGTLRVTIGGRQHTLIVGGTTPGGGDQYARDADNNTLYAVNGETIRNLTHAEQRLFERDLHGFDMDDIDALRVTYEGKTRTLKRVSGSDKDWADADNPSVADETVGNWVDKVKRLQPSEYVEEPPSGLGPNSVVVRIEYLEGRRHRGFLELSRVKGEKDSTDYLVRTERTRKWFAKVLKSTAEQVEQDVTSVVR